MIIIRRDVSRRLTPFPGVKRSRVGLNSKWQPWGLGHWGQSSDSQVSSFFDDVTEVVGSDRGVRPGISQYPYPSSDHHLPEPQ